MLTPAFGERMAALWKRHWLLMVEVALAIFAIFWVTTFKIMDRDFWWHIKAGEILLKTHRMIQTDPFAYTRLGLPYLATHEWLAQIFLYLIYHLGGPTGIILFRGVVATVSTGLLMLLATRPRPAYLLLGVWAIVITKGSFLERPQLFTFLFFCSFIVLAFKFLDEESERIRKRICAGFVGLELLWVNMHGGAALLGCAMVTFLVVDMGVRSMQPYRRRDHVRAGLLLAGTLALMSVTLVLPPNGLGTLTYLSQLLNDKTIAFIAEWQPREWPLYIKELWPFFVLSFSTLWLGRRHWVFNGLLLLMTAYLSRQAFRHEILFVFAAVATCVYQMERDGRTERMQAWMRNHFVSVGIASLLVVLFLGRIAYERSFAFERQDNLFGFGQFDLARGAYDFIEKEHIAGNMFNTYGIGGYLINRGYPGRKVFIDGRNVDYGFDFMARAYAAGIDVDQWDALVRQYDITYAIVDYDAIKQDNRLPYSSVLDTHPDWALVYVDDWVAVYLKRIPENKAVIDAFGYAHITATRLQFDNAFSKAEEKDLPSIATELRRAQDDSPESIKATMGLANIALRQGNIAEARTLALRAKQVRPTNPEPLAILAATYIHGQQWQEAADIYDELLRLAGDNYPNLDRNYIADVFEKAGHPWKAWYERLGTKRGTPIQLPTSSGSVTSAAPGPGVNLAADAQQFNDEGLSQAEAGKFADAEESFKTSLKINPSNAGTWNNLCALFLTQQRISDAIDACKHAIRLDADFGDAHFNLALAYYHKRSAKEAEQEALRAKKLGHEKESDELLLLIRKIQL